VITDADHVYAPHTFRDLAYTIDIPRYRAVSFNVASFECVLAASLHTAPLRLPGVIKCSAAYPCADRNRAVHRTDRTDTATAFSALRVRLCALASLLRAELFVGGSTLMRAGSRCAHVAAHERRESARASGSALHRPHHVRVRVAYVCPSTSSSSPQQYQSCPPPPCCSPCRPPCRLWPRPFSAPWPTRLPCAPSPCSAADCRPGCEARRRRG
jgi:hypothetical protein